MALQVVIDKAHVNRQVWKDLPMTCNSSPLDKNQTQYGEKKERKTQVHLQKTGWPMLEYHVEPGCRTVLQGMCPSLLLA